MDPIQIARWDVFGNVIRRTCPDCTTGQSRLSWYQDWFKLMRAPAVEPAVAAPAARKAALPR